MPKSLIASLSLGGTTAHVAERIAAGLQSAGYEVDLCNLAAAQPPPLHGYDLLGIGAPAYYFRPPFIITDYVNGLPDLAGRSFFVYVLHGTYPGDTGNDLRHALDRKGAKEVGYFTCYGADYFLGYLKERYLFSPDHPTAEELASAEAFGRDVATRMAGEVYVKQKYDPASGLMYRLERALVSRWLVSKLYSRMFRLDVDACTACGLCAELCPTGNITQDEDGHPVWGRDCLLCLNCEMKCPQDAIASPVTSLLFRPTMIYNVHHAMRDKSLGRVRVTHSHGRTERV
jgi:ferredoxin/flavodoxin